MKTKLDKLPGLELPDLHIRTRLHNAEGKIVSNKYQVGHSWTYNAWVAAFGMLTDAPGWVDGGVLHGLRTQDTGGDLSINGSLFCRNDHAFAGYGFWNNGISNTFGIIVGTSDEPFHINDYKLEGLVDHGTSEGQLVHVAQVIPVVSFADHKYKVTHQRIFNNNSGGEITIKEIGMLYKGSHSLAARLFTRDVLDSPDVIPNGYQYTVEVEMTSVSLEALASTWKSCFDVPAGTQAHGGTFIGNVPEWSDKHQKYGLVLSPKVGGTIASVQWKTTNTDPPNLGELADGWEMTPLLQAIGAESPMQQATDAINADTLNGFDDWYIPSYYEVRAIRAVESSIPSGEYPDSGYHWTSSRKDNDEAYQYDFVNNLSADPRKDTSAPVRLVRRLNLQTA